MGIEVEFNPDLALRNISHNKTGSRARQECIPENLKEGEIYDFLKRGQRNYWLQGEIPLLETEGYQRLSRPIAAITILECTHFVRDKEVWTKGKYQVEEVFDPDDETIHFESYKRVKSS